jgi:hypothetical protein
MVAFYCYNPSGLKGRGFHAWYDHVSPEYRSEIDVVLELIERDATLEESGLFKDLRGRCSGLTQIKIDFPDDRARRGETHFRILGYGTPDRFVLLCGFQKHSERDYGHACRSANTRKRSVEKDGRRARRCRFSQPDSTNQKTC